MLKKHNLSRLRTSKSSSNPSLIDAIGFSTIAVAGLSILLALSVSILPDHDNNSCRETGHDLVPKSDPDHRVSELRSQIEFFQTLHQSELSVPDSLPDQIIADDKIELSSLLCGS